MSRKLFIMLEYLPQNKLPTSHQVLQRYEYMRTNSKDTKSMSVNKLIDEIIYIWNKAYIPVMEKNHIKRKLLNSKKSTINRYIQMKKHKDRIDLSIFNELFDIKSDSAKFRNEEDRLFYLDQKDPEKRVATLGSVDILDNEKIICNNVRYTREELKEQNKEVGKVGKRRARLEVTDYPLNEKRHRNTGKYVIDEEDKLSNIPEEDNVSIIGEEDNVSNTSAEDKDSDWEEVIPSSTKYWQRKRDTSKINISLDKDTFLDNIAHMADKTFTSSRTAVQIACATLSTAGDFENNEISHLTVSHSTLHRKRDELRISSDKLITENWRKKKENTLFLLHWDEKTLSHLRQVDGSNAYMAVVLTDLFTGEEKILSIIEMKNSTAEEGVSSVIMALQQWKINKKNIIGCVFDTTNTNSGWKSGILV